MKQNQKSLWKNIQATLKMIIVIITFFVPLTLYSQTTEDNEALNKMLVERKYKAIPMNKLISGHLYFEVEINGQKGLFILDTGAGGSVVEEKRKEKFKLKTEKPGLLDYQVVGAGGSQLSGGTSLDNKLKIKDFTIDDFSLVLMNLEHINSAFRQLGIKEIDGVIGADILSDGRAIIDYTGMILYLKQESN